MTAITAPSLIDMQRQALADIEHDALLLANIASRLSASLKRSQDLGVIIAIPPASTTEKQAAVLEHIRKNYAFGLPPSDSKEDLAIRLSLEIDNDTGVFLSEKTVDRTLTKFGLQPERAQLRRQNGGLNLSGD